MLEGLFEDPDSGTGFGTFTGTSPGQALDKPPSPRVPSGLCGIYNQGATCYMNSLLQTLLMTPEFRESLFVLGPEELGNLENRNQPGAKVRVIPIELQRLFTRLLLLQSQAVATTDLTRSFGWAENEFMYQQDVQELNRILFSAIEDSLVGTSGQTLIHDLYQGTIVNQIVCLSCAAVSEREEGFTDLCVPVSGHSGLEGGLAAMYGGTEALDGSNQYRCEGCQRLRDATKGAKLRRLPHILTLSLLRFSLDMKKMEWYKETGKFSFPHEINMAEYCENGGAEGDTEYELFSVVIHRGSTHGGHYHAYIRDIDNLGNWTHPDAEEVCLPTDPETGKVDFIEFDSPIELLQALLSRYKDGLPVDKLCAELSKQTGVSWNKRFKKTHGPINKFLRKYDDKFVLNPATNWVSLKTYSGQTDAGGQANTGECVNSTAGPPSPLASWIPPDDSASQPTPPSYGHPNHTGAGEKPTLLQMSEKSGQEGKTVRSPSPPPEIGHRWFDFDDSRVGPIRAQELEKQFSGKESAYMLFYRRKSLRRPQEALGDPSHGLPPPLLDLVLEENHRLATDRHDYEVKMNAVTLSIHFTQFYSYSLGALQSLSDGGGFIELTIDRRKTIVELRGAVTELGGELMCEHFVIHTAKQLPAGMHVYHCLTDQPEASLQSKGVCHKDDLFVWDGHQVGGDDFLTGLEHEPIYLNITHSGGATLSRGFPRSLTLGEMKLIVADMTGNPQVAGGKVARIVTKGDQTECFPVLAEEEGKSLGELRLDNGDQLVCEAQTDSQHELAKQTVIEHTQKLSFIVELRCQAVGADGSYPVRPVEVHRDSSVGELKAVIVSRLPPDVLTGGGTDGEPEGETGGVRLRIDHENHGLCTPLHENQSLSDAGLRQGMKLVLEPGYAPTHNQITVRFSVVCVQRQGKELPHSEIALDRNARLHQCLTLMLQMADLTGDAWHLRRTNCFQEATGVIEDTELTLEEGHVQDGDLLLIESGRLPPKGFMNLCVYIHDPLPPGREGATGAQAGAQEETGTGPGAVQWLIGGMKALMGGDAGTVQTTPINDPAIENIPVIDKPPTHTHFLGEIIISKDATLSDLKSEIMMLPEVDKYPVPTPQFMRLRVRDESGKMCGVLRELNTTLQRLRLSSGSKVVIQLLQQEENLSAHQVVLSVLESVGVRQYAPARELVWDVSTAGATVQSLKQRVADLLVTPAEGLVIAKHLSDKYEWLLLTETSQCGKKKPRGKGGKGQKVNIRHAPYYIRDGDQIAVKRRSEACAVEDFCTEADLEGKVRAFREQEERKHRRKQNRDNNTSLDTGATGDSKKQTVAIKIHVDDFS